MRSRLGMSAYYKNKEGGGQDLAPCPGGSGTNTLTYLLIYAVHASNHSLQPLRPAPRRPPEAAV